ncbi:MAG: LacI family transcriptional regulator [Gammaproteobacteria bacterium]|nr:LacI family transcriptional regulator [Gammaproteobacteria bacterium]
MNKSTIYDVALRAKVSNATVSRALNTPEKVKPETRNKILSIAKELGYKPNAMARGLASSKSTQVAIIVSDLARASVAEMVKGISEVAESYGYNIILLNVKGDEQIDELLMNIVSLHVDGILYLNDELTEKQSHLVKELKDNYLIPIVLVNTESIGDDDLLSVTIDYEKAGYEACKSLIQEGRKRIVLLTTQKRYPVSILKENGYRRAMEKYGLEELICYTSGNLDINKSDIEQYLNEHKDIDGVIGVRDSISIAALNILVYKGKKIPEEVSVFGFQNTRYTLLCRPQLSTINVPIHELGARAMKILTTEMSGEVQDVKGKVILEHSIIKRGTTK